MIAIRVGAVPQARPKNWLQYSGCVGRRPETSAKVATSLDDEAGCPDTRPERRPCPLAARRCVRWSRERGRRRRGRSRWSRRRRAS